MKMKKMLFVLIPFRKEASRTSCPIFSGFSVEQAICLCLCDPEPGMRRRLAEEYGKDVELFVCSGGDGTLNSVISGIMRLEKRPEIGYLPAGSTNDFARSLKIPANLTKAAQDVVSGKSYGVDIGKFGDERYFVYIAAFGAFTEVSYSTPQDIKNVLGAIRHISWSPSRHWESQSYRMH